MAKTRKRLRMVVEVSVPVKGRAHNVRKLVGEMIQSMSKDWYVETGLFEGAPLKLISVKPVPKDAEPPICWSCGEPGITPSDPNLFA